VCGGYGEPDLALVGETDPAPTGPRGADVTLYRGPRAPASTPLRHPRRCLSTLRTQRDDAKVVLPTFRARTALDEEAVISRVS